MRTYKLLASFVFIVFLLGIGLGYTSAKSNCNYDLSKSLTTSRIIETENNISVSKAFVKNPKQPALDDQIRISYSLTPQLVDATGNCKNTNFSMGELELEEILPKGFSFVSFSMEGMKSVSLNSQSESESKANEVYYEVENLSSQKSKLNVYLPHLVKFIPNKNGQGNGQVKSWNSQIIQPSNPEKTMSELKWSIILKTSDESGKVDFLGTDSKIIAQSATEENYKRPQGNAYGYCKFPGHKKCQIYTSFERVEINNKQLNLNLYKRPILTVSKNEIYVNEIGEYTFNWSEAFTNTKTSFKTDTNYLIPNSLSNTATQIKSTLTGIQPKESTLINLSTVFSDFKEVNGASISLNHSVPIAVKLPKIVLAGSFADSLKKEIKVNQLDTLAFRLVTQENQSFTPSKPFTYTVTSSLPTALPVTSPTTAMTVPLNAKASANEVTVTIGLKDFSGSTVEKKLKVVEDGLTLSANELKVQVGSNATPLYGFRDQAGSDAVPTWFSGYRLTIESGDADAIEILSSTTANRPMIKGKSRGKVYVRLTALETVAVDTDNNPSTPAVNQLQPKQVNGSEVSARFKVLVYEDPTQINTSDLY